MRWKGKAHPEFCLRKHNIGWFITRLDSFDKKICIAINDIFFSELTIYAPFSLQSDGCPAVSLFYYYLQKDINETWEKFASFWPDFQQFNIMRTKRINEVMGYPLDGQIIQIVCWHLSMSKRSKFQLMTNVSMHGITR